MRDQAKKMNVASLRSSENQAQSAECKLAKVALMTITLWFCAWTPYLIINFAGIFQLAPISPLCTIWGSVFAKTNAVTTQLFMESAILNTEQPFTLSTHHWLAMVINKWPLLVEMVTNLWLQESQRKKPKLLAQAFN